MRITLVQVQFETIPPFWDGNGRSGRLLIAMFLEEWQILKEPLLFVLGYLKQHQRYYYQCLTHIRNEGNWEQWVSFFLEAVIYLADEALQSIIRIATLFAENRKKVLSMRSTSVHTIRQFECLPTMPKLTVERAIELLSVTYLANAAVKSLVEAEISTRHRSYIYHRYVELLWG